ncbi:MAG: hypothetical protein Kow00107_01560 [Planctomycetota bacterium]
MAKLMIRKIGYPDRSIKVNSPLVTLGRSKECDVVFRGDSKVSRKHAKIEFVKGVFYITDLDSANGTLVNDRLVKRRTQLKDGDKIVIGGTEVIFFSEGGIISSGVHSSDEVEPYVPTPEELAKHGVTVSAADKPDKGAKPVEKPRLPLVSESDADNMVACPKCGAVIDASNIPKGAKVGCAKCKNIFTV